MEKQQSNIENAAELFAQISTLLISSGANTQRTTRNVERFANALGYHCEMFFSFSATILTVYKQNDKQNRTIVRRIPHHGVNFNAISDISILSWEAYEKKLPIEEIQKEIDIIAKKPHYNIYLVWLFVALAGGSLAYIFGGKNGSYIEFGVSFLATFIGAVGRRILQLRKFNLFICWAWAAFVSVSVVNIFRFIGIEPLSNALAACVLWLIPGVPLINGFIDLLTAHIVSGGAKLLYAMVLVFMIAVGFYISLFAFGYELL